MFRTTFIAITGSVGKSTATAALGSILSQHFPTNWSPGARNDRHALAETILRTRFRHRFTVIEVGTRAPGALRRAAWVIAPDIVVMLRVLNVHSNAFPDAEAVAAEKAALLSRLGRRGVAILNADDPRVLAMEGFCRGPVRTFGVAPGAFLTAGEISSKWPARLRFRAASGGDSAWVNTKLVGEHMVYSALGALSAAVFCGVPLDSAARCFEDVQPVAARMQPVKLPNGATVLRNDHNPTLPALEVALDVMRTAEASRRIVILGDVLDSGLSERKRVRYVASRTAESVDFAVFLGELAKHAAKAAVAAGMPADSVRAFRGLPEMADFLRFEVRAGDLILVHGWIGRHVERAVLAQFGSISCWLERCSKVMQCETCSELGMVAHTQGLKPCDGGTLRHG